MKPEVTAETNLTGKKARKSPVPQDAKRITEGALKLPLRERVELKKLLSISIDHEITGMETDLGEAKKLIGG